MSISCTFLKHQSIDLNISGPDVAWSQKVKKEFEFQVHATHDYPRAVVKQYSINSIFLHSLILLHIVRLYKGSFVLIENWFIIRDLAGM